MRCRRRGAGGRAARHRGRSDDRSEVPFQGQGPAASSLSATSRSRACWRARYTTPIPPWPIFSSNSYSPKSRWIGSDRSMSSASGGRNDKGRASSGTSSPARLAKASRASWPISSRLGSVTGASTCVACGFTARGPPERPEAPDARPRTRFDRRRFAPTARRSVLDSVGAGV